MSPRTGISAQEIIIFYGCFELRLRRILIHGWISNCSVWISSLSPNWGLTQCSVHENTSQRHTPPIKKLELQITQRSLWFLLFICTGLSCIHKRPGDMSHVTLRSDSDRCLLACLQLPRNSQAREPSPWKSVRPLPGLQAWPLDTHFDSSGYHY